MMATALVSHLRDQPTPTLSSELWLAELLSLREFGKSLTDDPHLCGCGRRIDCGILARRGVRHAHPSVPAPERMRLPSAQRDAPHRALVSTDGKEPPAGRGVPDRGFARWVYAFIAKLTTAGDDALPSGLTRHSAPSR